VFFLTTDRQISFFERCKSHGGHSWPLLPYHHTLWFLVRIKGVLGVKVYGSRHPMSKRVGDTGMAKIRKERQTSGVHQPWGQGDGAEVRQY